MHLHGLPMNMAKVMAIARKHKLKVIEDACQAHGATFQGRKVGTWGHCAAFSFNQNKCLCSGEGGMFVTDDEEMLKKARQLWSFGETGHAAERRDYHAYALGWMYRNNDLTAAFGRAQLTKLDRYQAVLRENAERLAERLRGTPNLILPTEYPDAKSNWYNYTLRFDMRKLGHEQDAARLPRQDRRGDEGRRRADRRLAEVHPPGDDGLPREERLRQGLPVELPACRAGQLRARTLPRGAEAQRLAHGHDRPAPRPERREGRRGHRARHPESHGEHRTASMREKQVNELKIGWASRDVTTDKPIDIPGQFHIRVSEGVLDPITVNALVIANGADMVIFLSGDFVALCGNLPEDIRKKVASLNPAIPVSKILMNATHTHDGPGYWDDGASFPMAMPDEVPHDEVEIASRNEYRDFLSTQAAEAIVEAYTKRAPGGIAFGYGYAVLSHSRRVVYFDDLATRPGSNRAGGFMVAGHAAMYGKTHDDRFSHYEAGADHFINLLYTFDARKALTGAIINVPCPSQCSESESKLSADYWNDVRIAIRKRYGDIFILPQCAAAGDLSPRILHYLKAQQRRFRLKYGEGGRKDYDERKDISERIVCAFSEVLDWAKKDVLTALPITHVVETAQLSKRLISMEEAECETALLEELNKKDFQKEGTPKERLKHDSTLVAKRNRCRRILTRYERQDAEPRFPMELHVLRIGDVAFASNCFELYMDFMHRIQARSPFTQTFVIQLAGTNGPAGGYLATERGAWGKGYSASIYCNEVSPEGGQELVEETVKILKEIYAE